MAFPTPDDFVSKHAFDYIIIGGGTAGLAVAARLSENPNITVGVLEAGGHHPEEATINVPGYFGRSLGNPLFDWSYLTVPQEKLNGRRIFHPRGKLLGGSSALNFMASCRASKPEYDAYEAFGNDGWNWEEYTKYMNRSETAVPISPEDAEKYNLRYQEQFHGTAGPLVTSQGRWFGDVPLSFINALGSLGVELNSDPASGSNVGTSAVCWTADSKTGLRTTSASAYYEPNATRPNLVVLIDAQVTKIVLESSEGQDTLKATAVEFVSGGKPFSVSAKKEVILSAGAFQTPQLLELSGIGDKQILQPLDIPVKIDLPGVGANLQDHSYVLLTYEVDPKLDTFDVLRDEGRSDKEALLYKEQRGLLVEQLWVFSFLPLRAFVPAEEITRMKQVLARTTFEGKPGLEKRHKLLKEWFDDESQAQLELISYPGFLPRPGKIPKAGARYHSLFLAGSRPTSYGHVHITSADPLAPPTIDPKYLSSEVDRDILVNAVKFVRRLHATTPLKELTVAPREKVWTDDKQEGTSADAEQELRDFVANALEPVHHPIGTAAMLPREDGGVVNSKLIVHGTTNLRVVDASIFPLQLSTHPQATIYGLAEKAADLIKSTWVV